MLKLIEMVIKNFSQLNTTPLRGDALAIAEAGFAAIRVGELIKRQISIEKDKLKIAGNETQLSRYKKIFTVGIGKGSAKAMVELEKILTPRRIEGGHVIDVQKVKLSKVSSHVGTHPLPSEQNIQATEKLTQTLKKAGKDDLVIAIICGGGSSLACQPSGLSCLEMQLIFKMLLLEGAQIDEINIVRKHISSFHGGHLAELVYPAKLVALIISDVPGDDLSVISSGPTVLDPTTVEEAKKIIKKYQLPKFSCAGTPKAAKFFKNVDNILLASGKTAVIGMQKKAQELGYKVRILDTELHAFAKDLGPLLAKTVNINEALLASGETEVVVKHPGRGGRNQEVVLSAIPYLQSESVVMSLASDGKDNEPVAGAIADSETTVQKLEKLGEDPLHYVEMNNSFVLLDKLDEHLHIDTNTANVSDFMLALRR